LPGREQPVPTNTEAVAELFLSPALYPLTLSADHAKVEFVRMTADSYKNSSFLDDRICRADECSTSASLDDLIAYRATHRSHPQVGLHYVFHSAFCGSTLLSRYLEASNDVLVLREPLILTILETLTPQRYDFFPRWPAALDVAMALLTRPFPETRSVVVKLNDTCITEGPDLLDWDPAATATFLYSNLPMFISQVLKAPERLQWIYDRAHHLKDIIAAHHYPKPNAGKFDHATACAFVWSTYMLLYRKLRRSAGSARIRAFDSGSVYNEPDTLLSWCLNEPQDSRIVSKSIVRDVASSHSKTGVPFDNENRIRLLTENILTYAAQIDRGLQWVNEKCPTLLTVAIGKVGLDDA
jgi:hypothetical protein